MRPLFSFRWRSSGASWLRWLVRLAPVWEEEEDDRLGHEGELGRPRGRGPVGRGGQPVEKMKKRIGRGWAERPDGPKVKKKIPFRIKF
jgi:hypothetical protein